MLKYNSDKQKLCEYAKENREAIHRMDEDTMAAMLALLGEQKRLMEILKNPRGEEEMDMCVAIDELIADGKAAGNAEGENRMADLAAALLLENRTDLLVEAIKDKQLRIQLFEQYRL